MKKYYDILGIPDTASIEEIKKAFRTKAKQLHPDVNKSATAETDFIQVNEAYEYLINIKLGLKFDTSKQKYKSSGSYGKDWSAPQEEAARQRAEYYAKKKYQDYVNSKFYKDSVALEDLASFIVIAFYFTLVFIVPLIVSFFYGIAGLWAFLLIGLITSGGWLPIVKEGRFPPTKNIIEGFQLAIKLRGVRVFGSMAIFALTFFTIGFQTFITIFEILKYLLLIFVAIAILRRKSGSFKNAFLPNLSIALVCIAFLLNVNYFISFNEKEEVYEYSRTTVPTGKGGKGRGRGSMIILENNTYQKYPSVRFFFDYNDVIRTPGISYITREGILTYKVYTKRVFK